MVLGLTPVSLADVSARLTGGGHFEGTHEEREEEEGTEGRE